MKPILPLLAILSLGACTGDQLTDCRNATFAVIGAQTLYDRADRESRANPDDAAAQSKAADYLAAKEGAIAAKDLICAPAVL